MIGHVATITNLIQEIIIHKNINRCGKLWMSARMKVAKALERRIQAIKQEPFFARSFSLAILHPMKDLDNS
ncbi:MAG: hypothetical protein C0616_04490 [Desulfuromonas sp.]|nr:MAG: hypothetical protein C0616_04490 [Desulfuromonas sp.]